MPTLIIAWGRIHASPPRNYHSIYHERQRWFHRVLRLGLHQNRLTDIDGTEDHNLGSHLDIVLRASTIKTTHLHQHAVSHGPRRTRKMHLVQVLGDASQTMSSDDNSSDNVETTKDGIKEAINLRLLITWSTKYRKYAAHREVKKAAVG